MLSNAETNRPSAAGSLASKKVLFGDYKRYACAAVHTRFDDVEWFIWDADIVADGERPDVIFQGTRDEALLKVDRLINP